MAVQPAASACLIMLSCKARSFIVYSCMAWFIGPILSPAERTASME